MQTAVEVVTRLHAVRHGSIRCASEMEKSEGVDEPIRDRYYHAFELQPGLVGQVAETTDLPALARRMHAASVLGTGHRAVAAVQAPVHALAVVRVDFTAVVSRLLGLNYAHSPESDKQQKGQHLNAKPQASSCTNAGPHGHSPPFLTL